MEGPIKSPLSVRPSVRPSVSLVFASKKAQKFFLIFGTMVDNWNI